MVSLIVEVISMHPKLVLVRSGPKNGHAVALLLHDYRNGKAWILKWRTSKRAFALHPRIERGPLPLADWSDPRAQDARSAYERGEAEPAIERLKYLIENVFNRSV